MLLPAATSVGLEMDVRTVVTSKPYVQLQISFSLELAFVVSLGMGARDSRFIKDTASVMARKFLSSEPYDKLNIEGCLI